MRLGHLIRSRVFRLTLVACFLFSATAIGLVVLLYWTGSQAVSRQIDATIDAEIQGLAEQYSQRGTAGLIQALDRRVRRAGRSGALYLLVQSDGGVLAGNLNRWPSAEPNDQGRMRFELEWTEDGRKFSSIGRARMFRLPGKLRLLVGQDIKESLRVEEQFREALILGGLALIVLVLGAGSLLSWLILRRVDSISATSGEIMAGDLSRRVPLTGSGDEFDRLATQLNNMLEQNERLFRGLQEVAENIAHDLRSPLGRLRTRLEAVSANSGLSDAARQEEIGAAIAEADRLLRTFNAILKIAQAESGAPRRRFGAVDLAEVLRDLAELYEPIVEEAGLSLESDIPAGAVPVQGDRDLLFQAGVNLIDNAIKYAGRGHTVRIGLEAGAASAAVQIADDGPGMSEDSIARARDRFFRGDAARTTEGSGLGLSLVDAVARLHRGDFALAAASSGDDARRGLKATLTLPLDRSPPAPDKAGETASAPDRTEPARALRPAA